MISKFAPKRLDKIIPFSEINEKELKLITNTNDYYADKNGNIFRKYPNGYLRKKPYLAKCGYYYIELYMSNNKRKTFRLHRVIAKTFLENSKNYEVVGHKNNIKTDNRVSNLYWTTYQENTQKAVNDGLMVNDKGYEDSQSHPVICYDCDFNEIGRYGSVTECHKALGVSKSTIIRHCDGQIKGKTRSGYYFRYQNA